MQLTPDQIIENGVAEIHRGFFRLRKDKRYQEEYDAMGTIISMLSEARQHMRKTFKLEI